MEMNVQRFTGRTNKMALEQVRTVMGPEALILSNKRTAEGVEICAMLETGEVVSAIDHARPAGDSLGGGTNEIALAHLKRELTDLRETLHAALGERRWQDSAGKRPVVATIEQRLATLGLDRKLIGELVDELASDVSLDAGWREAVTHLARRIEILTDAEQAGLRVKAIVGGACTDRALAIQQLAEVALSQHPASDVAVISMLEDPSSALGRYCHERDVASYMAPDAASLKKALAAVKNCRQVFIETPDLLPSKGSQDPSLIALLNQRAGLTVLLVLPCSAQSEYLQLLADHSEQLPLVGAVLTGLEEATSLGAVLGILADRELPVAGVADRTHQSLLQITAEGLISESKRLARRNLDRKNQELKVAV
jgi:flagellar biosynthesis protein FlhF